MRDNSIKFIPVDDAKSLNKEDLRFSILIPTWNNLDHLKLCISSIHKNSRYRHQIILHVNDGSDGTLDWVEANKLAHTHSNENSGVCFAFNAAASLATSDYLLLLDDDNYLLPDWDHWLIEEIRKIDHPFFAISATKIERVKTFNPCVISPFDFGSGPADFNEAALLEAFEDLEMDDWNGSSWYPMAVHRSVWQLVGGMSIEFSPGMYSDPDFMMKLWQAGVRYFKGVSKSRTYHFMSKSVKRIKKNNGRKQFLLKWRMSNSTFRNHYLRMGDKFTGYLDEPEIKGRLQRRLLRDRLKLFFTV
jgi:glycosyltransferase involved in cell wall biosynthesis